VKVLILGVGISCCREQHLLASAVCPGAAVEAARGRWRQGAHTTSGWHSVQGGQSEAVAILPHLRHDSRVLTIYSNSYQLRENCLSSLLNLPFTRSLGSRGGWVPIRALKDCQCRLVRARE
jgi:hypothetical protein